MTSRDAQSLGEGNSRKDHSRGGPTSEPHPVGDNLVDAVDNSRVTSSDQGGSDQSRVAGVGSDGASLRGPDLARAALAAAREQSKSKPKRSAARGPVRAAPRRRGWSGPGKDERDPQPLGRLAARLATERGWSGKLSGGRVINQWAALVGGDIAEHTTAESLDDGVLTVRAESTAWATQLRLLQRQILQRIADAVGNDVVKRIKVHGPAAPSWRRGPRHVAGRGPRDTYG